MKIKKLVKEVNKLSEKKRLKFVSKMLDSVISGKSKEDVAEALQTGIEIAVKIGDALGEPKCECKNISGMNEVIKAIGSEFIGDKVKIWSDKETLHGVTTYSLFFQDVNVDDDEDQVLLYSYTFPNGEALGIVGMNAGETGEKVKAFCEDLFKNLKDRNESKDNDDDENKSDSELEEQNETQLDDTDSTEQEKLNI